MRLTQAIVLLKIGLSLGCASTEKLRMPLGPRYLLSFRFTPAILRRYVYLLMGVLIGSAVCPIAFCMVWSKCTSTGAISGALAGLVAAVCGWLGYTKANYGVVNLATTGAPTPALWAFG